MQQNMEEGFFKIRFHLQWKSNLQVLIEVDALGAEDRWKDMWRGTGEGGGSRLIGCSVRAYWRWRQIHGDGTGSDVSPGPRRLLMRRDGGTKDGGKRGRGDEGWDE